MIQSNFTLCPGGDFSWSHRWFEAILAGSIPVIHSEQEDYSGTIADWYNKIGYTYFTTDQVVNMNKTMSSEDLMSIADKNYDLLLKYQTWIYGDNIPHKYMAHSGPCALDATCHDLC